MAADSQTLPIFKREWDRNPLGLAARPAAEHARKWHISLLARQDSFGSFSPRRKSAVLSPPRSQGVELQHCHQVPRAVGKLSVTSSS